MYYIKVSYCRTGYLDWGVNEENKKPFFFRKTFLPLCTYATAGVEFGWQENQYDQKVDDVYSTTIES